VKHVLLVSFSDRSNPFHRDPPVAITHRRLYSLYRVADTSDRGGLLIKTKLTVTTRAGKAGNREMDSPLNSEIESFFDSAPPLNDRAAISEKLKEFIALNSRVACVTSGGTTVPLEQRCVRYIDNFSSGHRGAASTEHLIKMGYAVIFLYRRGTCEPYCSSLPDDAFLECFEVTKESAVQGSSRRPSVEASLYNYIRMLQMIAVSSRSLGPCSMFYLAAAVSDFYVPWKSMAEHKIQSGSGPLDIQLLQVPKMLSVLRKEWAPMAFCISFKLETDAEILLEKADMARKKYGMHAVVANELLSRKEQVVVVTNNGKIPVYRDKTSSDSDVEKPLTKLLVDRHSVYIKDSNT
ncbi:hypothetical protein CUMW_159070, partial [Citrus unshiu]